MALPTSLTAKPLPVSADAGAIHRNRIFLRRLRMEARIGVHDWEKAAPQPIMLDIECALPSTLACTTDRIEHTVDYDVLVQRLRRFAMERPCQLVEAMAEGMAALIQREFGIPWLSLTLTKLAPFPGAEVGIVVERQG